MTFDGVRPPFPSTHRFFVPPESIKSADDGYDITIEGEEAHHAVRVLRLTQGDIITVLDGLGDEYEATIRDTTFSGQLETSQPTITAHAAVRRASQSEPPVRITLIQALPKSDKMDEIIQKGTEVGVTRFRPVFSDRVIVKYSPEKVKHRLQRWRKIAKEAAKQSGRGVIPDVEPPTNLSFAIQAEKAGDSQVLFFWEGATEPLYRVADRIVEHFKNGTKTPRQSTPQVSIVIGPEGGFSEKEAEVIEHLGGVAVSLGPRLLRTETAGPVATSLVIYALTVPRDE